MADRRAHGREPDEPREPGAKPRLAAKASHAPQASHASQASHAPRAPGAPQASHAPRAARASDAARRASEADAALGATRDDLLRFLREMLLIRRFEEKAGQLYGMGLIGGFCHLYIGQEAVVTGLQACAGQGDNVVTTYRDHGHMLACGMDPKGVMAELTGRRDGCSKGKGGSMHMFSKERSFYGGHGIVGANVPIGAGLALAERYRGTDRVTFTYFGDGAANQGQVHETYNMAELWDLAVVFVIENNGHAMGTSVERSTKSPSLRERGAACGIEGEEVDGMDVLAVRAAGARAAAHCRSGEGPYILEMRTHRYRGHSMSDPAKHRARDEVQRIREERDPIEQVRGRLIEAGMACEDELKEIDRGIKAVVNEAAEFAKESPEPDEEELWTDVHAKDVPQGITAE